MITRISILCALATFNLALAAAPMENVAVVFLHQDQRHEFNAVAGCPTNWPVIVDRLGTNTASPHAGRTIMTVDDYSALTNSLGSRFSQWHRTTWAGHRKQQQDAAAATQQTVQLELQQLIAECDVAATNWANLTPPQKDAILPKLLRIDQLRRR